MTTPVVLTGQLNELVLVSNSAKNVSAATINEILQKTPGGNTLGIDPEDTSTFHSYDVRTGICLVTNPNCTVENVFEALKRYPAPGATGESIYDGAITDVVIGPFGAGPVVHYLDRRINQRERRSAKLQEWNFARHLWQREFLLLQSGRSWGEFRCVVSAYSECDQILYGRMQLKVARA